MRLFHDKYPEQVEVGKKDVERLIVFFFPIKIFRACKRINEL